ncbi:BAG family molecular chaperone regulator 3-like [Phragmites australis]|uniref:BAG family molecular chaperone regulator 3-like n=1 Tax=Phragmites australis TaxID=29695 RepID=UPI002D77D1C7|nr:BAG family molecular chaperone regulator 3-like [Phragmites australis]
MLGASPKAKKGVPVKLGSMKNAHVAATGAGAPAGGKVPAEEVWEVRPGGMLVQKRGGALSDDEPSANVKPVPTIRVKVKHAGVTHEIYISSEASFGELKKMVAAKTGLHPDDQKVLYKDKERDSKAFLDMAGVKDRSKVVVVEDPEARARRLIEERRNGHLEKAVKAVAAVTAEVDKLAPKVAALDASVRKGEKVAENDVAQVTELLMNELLKLDAVVADGDVKAQRRMQVKRVQKYVETLDVVMAKNAAIVRKAGEKVANAKQQQQPPQPRQQQSHHQYQQQQQPAAQTRWEMFDLLSSLPSTSSASSTTTVSSTASSGAPPANRLDWMLF